MVIGHLSMVIGHLLAIAFFSLLYYGVNQLLFQMMQKLRISVFLLLTIDC